MEKILTKSEFMEMYKRDLERKRRNKAKAEKDFFDMCREKGTRNIRNGARLHG